MKKRVLFYVAFMMVALGSYAYDFEVDGMYYNMISMTDLTCSVCGGGKRNGDIVIPEKVIYKNRELTVTSIGEWAFFNRSDLTSITIPNSITSIGIFAFYKCSGLTSITIPNSVTYIGGAAFEGCSGLTSITIPNSVTYIGGSAFCNCSGLTSITIPNSVTFIGGTAFHDCSKMEQFLIDDGETVLDWENGFNKSPLKYVYIGRKLSYTDYNSSPFRYCRDIMEVTFGRNITEIYNYVDFPKIETMSLLNPTPPSVSDPKFTNTQYMNMKVYVPKGSLEAYQQAPVWCNFWELQEKDFTGIETVATDDSGTDAVIYDMQGRRLDVPKAGLNIINGKKVMIKKP